MLKLFSLRRWETYCLLAIASVTWLLIVSVRTNPRLFHHRTLHAAAAEDLVRVPAVPRSRESSWVKRHSLIRKKAAAANYDVMLLGDSITQGWEYQPDVWQERFPNLKTINAGIASDRVENVLWRTRYGLLTIARPKVVVLMAGINNLAVSTPQKIAGGLQEIIDEIHRHSPATQILLLGLLPSGEQPTHPRRAKIRTVNQLVAKLGNGYNVHYLDTGAPLLDLNGTLTREVSFDGVHLTHHGYQIWAKALQTKLPDLVGRLSH